MILGENFETTTDRIDFTQSYTYTLSEKTKDIQSIVFDVKLLLPFVRTNLKVNGESNKNLVKYNVDGQFQKHQLKNSLNARLNGKQSGDYDVNFALALNSHNLQLDVKRNQANDKSQISNKLVISTGTKVELNGYISHDITPENADIKLNGLIVLAEKEEPYK